MRQNTNPDTVFVGDFKGMATVGGSYSATPEYLHSLVNATVTKDGTLVSRKGSKTLVVTTVDETTYTEEFRFSFAGIGWVINRYGVSFDIKAIQTFGLDESWNTSTLAFKGSLLTAQSASEPATYAVQTKGNYCHILIATKSTQLIGIVLSKREAVVTATTGTTASANIGQWYTTTLSVSNTKVLINGLLDNPLTSITNSTSSSAITATWTTKPPEIVVGGKITFVSCFWVRYCDSNYYQGNQFFNSSLRRNTVALDVNVPVPESTAANYIFNEPLQDLNQNTTYVYNDTNVNAAVLTRNYGFVPSGDSQWDFSNGSYRAVANQQVTRTKDWIAFGGLQTGNINTRVHFARFRHVLVSDFESPDISNLLVAVDKGVSSTVSYGNSIGSIMTSGVPIYFGFVAKAGVAPGVAADAVVEIIYTLDVTGATVSNNVVDISDDSIAHAIGDGFIVPLYGYNLVAKTKNRDFPDVVRFIGNRLVLSGNSNKILISSSEWNYRGFTFNNCQVSSLDYNENSPYLLKVDQTGADITTIESVNGVILVFNGNGVYRVSGKDRNQPPNAIIANISKLSSQIVKSPNDCITADNAVYFANVNGLYGITYSNESNDGVVTELSIAVSNLFKTAIKCVNYSSTLNSILISFVGRRKLLRLDLLTNTWSLIHVAIPYDLRLSPTWDGYSFHTGTVLILLSWSPTFTEDLANISSFVTAFTVAANTQTIATTVTATPSLVSLPEMLQLYRASGGDAVPAYNGNARAVGSPSVVTETSAGKFNKPVIAQAITKDLYTDKATRGIRLRGISLFAKGTGRIAVAVVGTEANNISRHTMTIATDGSYSITGAKQKSHTGQPVGDTCVAYLSDIGIANAWGVAFEIGASAEVVGFALDTSAKTLQRLT
jgi:hypothetical protein